MEEEVKANDESVISLYDNEASRHTFSITFSLPLKKRLGQSSTFLATISISTRVLKNVVKKEFLPFLCISVLKMLSYTTWRL